MRKILLVLIVFICSLAVEAQNVVYLQSNKTSYYWNRHGNQNALNALYGNGNWQDLKMETVNTASILVPAVKFIFIDGSNAGTCEFITFLDNNYTALQAWVSAGGTLFLNAAPNECYGKGINLYFGNTLLTYNPSLTGQIVNTTHPIFQNGTFQPCVADVYRGSYFAHATISGTSLSNILTGSKSLPILSEKFWGNGHVIFGGLTLAFINEHAAWTPEPNLFNFYKNLLQYAQKSAAAVASIVSPIPVTKLCAGTSLDISYTTNSPYNAGNNFTAQLSDALGGFTSPTIIGSVAAVASGNIEATIPVNLPAGSAYRIRVVSDNPVVIGSDNGNNITINASPLPTMTVQADITVDCGGVPPLSTIPFSNGIDDGCLISGTSNTSTQTQIPPACGGTITETWTAMDLYQRTIVSVSRTITVNPAVLPTMMALDQMTVDCGGLPQSSTISFSNGLSGNCLISGTSDPSTFSAAPNTAAGGTVTETWTATDDCGRMLAPVSRIITVSAAALPMMTALDPTTVDCGGLPKPSSIAFSNGLNGICLISGTSDPSTLSAAPATAAGGTVTETWTATDAFGRMLAPVSRMITVSAATLPTMTALPAITVAYYGAMPAASTISYSNLLSDVCLISGTSNPSTFTTIPDAKGGPVTETWTATDNLGRTIVAVSRLITVSSASIFNMIAPSTYTASCGNVPAASSIVYGNLGGGKYLVMGKSDLSTRTAMPGVAGGTFVETWTAKDKMGKTIIPVSRIITVSAAKLPFMNAPADITVENDKIPAASSISYSNYSDGSCMLAGTSNTSTLSAMPGANGSKVTETWTATDAIGRNLKSVSRIITVRPAVYITMIAPSGYSLSCGYIPAASRINFGNFSGGNYSIMGTSNLSTKTATPGVAGGTITETWTANDFNGKPIAAVSRTLIVNAASVAVMNAPSAITVAYAKVPAPSQIMYNNYSTGSCSVTDKSNPSTLSGMVPVNGGTVIETWTATDKAGRIVAPVSRIITVKAAVLMLGPGAARSMTSSDILKSKLDVTADDKLSVYPNPARGVINLKVAGDGSKVTSVEITDVLGKVVYSSKHYQSVINLSNHVTGTYFIRVNNNSKITTTKVVMVR